MAWVDYVLASDNKVFAKNGVRVYRSGCLFMVISRPKYGFTQWRGSFSLTKLGWSTPYDAIRQGVSEVLRRSMPENTEGVQGQLPEAGDFGTYYPTLWEYLTATSYGDGSARKTSSLTIFAGDGMMKAVLKDKELGTCLWMAAPGMDGLFVLVEAALADPKTVWRLDRQDNAGKSSRVQKGR